MNALLLIYVLLFIAFCAFNSGVFIMWGLGWMLISLSAWLAGFAVLLIRGLTNNEE